MKKTLLMAALAAAAVGGAFGGGEQAVSTFTDKRDGKVYKIVEINGQVWFAENLNYAAEGSVCYGENGPVYGWRGNRYLSDAEVQANCTKYGRLYDWETAKQACPAGTHIPSDDEWTALTDYAGDLKTARWKLMSSTGWEINNGTDDYGFSALPGGNGYKGVFYNIGIYGSWWSATEYGADRAWCQYVSTLSYRWEKGTTGKTNLLSVRCAADKEAKK